VYSLSAFIRDYRVFLLTSRQNTQEVKCPNIEMIRLYRRSDLDACGKMRLAFWLLTARRKIDLIHAFFTPRRLTAAVLKAAARRHGARFVQTIPTLPDQEKLSYRSFSHAEALVAMSDHTLGRLRRIGCERARRIYPGVDIDRFSPHVETDSLRGQLGIARNCPVVLYAGEYSRLGSFHNLLSWVPEVARHVPDAKFIFAVRIKRRRDRQIENRVKRLLRDKRLSEKVILLNFVRDMPALHRLATVHVFPVDRMSGKFDLPMVLLEAMASGRPIVTSDNVPLGELFRGDIGFQIPYKDICRWRDVLVRLLRDEVQCRQMGDEGRRVVKGWFDIKAVAKEYEALYKEVI